MATPVLKTMAPPRPWRILPAMSRPTVPAAAQTAEAAVLMTAPQRKILFRPRMSAILPKGRRKRAEDRR